MIFGDTELEDTGFWRSEFEDDYGPNVKRTIDKVINSFSKSRMCFTLKWVNTER